MKKTEAIKTIKCLISTTLVRNFYFYPTGEHKMVTDMIHLTPTKL